MIAAVLLVPTKGDPHRLLEGGPCGSYPPMAHMRPRPPGTTGPVEWGEGEKGYATPHALVLAWEGKPLRVAQPWLSRGLQAYPDDAPEHPLHVALAVDSIVSGRSTSWTSVLPGDLARIGTVVYLDEDGNEVPS